MGNEAFNESHPYQYGVFKDKKNQYFKEFKDFVEFMQEVEV